MMNFNMISATSTCCHISQYREVISKNVLHGSFSQVMIITTQLFSLETIIITIIIIVIIIIIVL